MQIQVHADRHIKADERLAEFVRETLQNKLNRFAEHLTRIEVHLSDENGHQRNDGYDKRCMLEARFEGLEPVAITEHAATVGQTVTGAADKLQRKLSSMLGKIRDNHVKPHHPVFAQPGETS